MSNGKRFHYEPSDEEPLSVAVVSAVATAHHEDVLDQHWILSHDINPDALDSLFLDAKPNMTLTFDADKSTVTIDIDERGEYTIEIESHR